VAPAVQPKQHRQGGVIAVEAFGGEQERAQLPSVHAVALARLDLGSADVLCRVRRDASVDVSEPVEAAHRRETPVNRGGSQPALLERAAVKPDVRAGSLQHGKADVDGPLEEAAEILTIGVERAAAVSS
jgi:hypothetical protein